MTMEDDPSLAAGGYSAFQLARALAATEHADETVRRNAAKRVRQWTAVIEGQRGGAIATGSRTPLKDMPAWVTPEVATGGFATGALLAGGAFQAHERTLRDELAPGVPEADARGALNSFFLTDAGLERLGLLLDAGRFELAVPEEGALLAVAWLLRAGHVEQAWELVEAIAPWFSRLRFYPVELAEARTQGTLLWVDDVATVMQRLRAVKPNAAILAQKEAVEVWAPLHDRMAALLFETVRGDAPIALRTADGAWQRGEANSFVVSGGWPCAHYPEGWHERAAMLLDQYRQARALHARCGRPEREGDSFFTLREGLRRCVEKPAALSGREVGRLRLVLARYRATHGLPGAAERLTFRQRQRDEAGAPPFEQIGRQVAHRLEAVPPEAGLDDIEPFLAPVDASEAAASGIREGTTIPHSVRRKLARALEGTAGELVERGAIPSGEALARVLPRWTAALRAADIADPALRRLQSAIDQAFRRRRSLLLLNLERQVQLAELPWVAATARFRAPGSASREAARQALTEIARLALTSFPQAILPNKLLQELGALAEMAGLPLPFVEEIAADIFMGRFSPKFLEAARLAADVVEGSLYARYYGIDGPVLRALRAPQDAASKRGAKDAVDVLARLGASRAGIEWPARNVVRNGMVIEQVQVLTTHNLALLLAGSGLRESLAAQLPAMARRCFEWICAQLQLPAADRHASLIRIKSSAYAWRQMVFFLSQCRDDEVIEFLGWSRACLGGQAKAFKRRFEPILSGLVAAATTEDPRVQPFMGWTEGTHCLMQDDNPGR